MFEESIERRTRDKVSLRAEQVKRAFAAIFILAALAFKSFSPQLMRACRT